MAHLGKPITTRKGTAYRVKWRDLNGAFRERAVYGKREALAFKAQVEADLSRGAYTDDRRGRTPLAEVAEEWLAGLTQAKPRTVAEYRRLLDSRVLPHFGERRAVGSIKRSHVAPYVAALKADGLRAPAAVLRPPPHLRLDLGDGGG